MVLKKNERKGSESVMDLLVLSLAVLMIGAFVASLFTGLEVPVWDPIDDEEEISYTIQVGDSLFPDTMIVHKRVWRDNWSNQYRGSAKVLTAEVRAAGIHRENLELPFYYESSWGKLYESLVNYKESDLKEIISMLDSIRVEQQLSTVDFADVIVTFVQDIPYVLILEQHCNYVASIDSVVRHILKNGTECYGHIAFGVYSPAEFIGTLHGDCDTRTTLLYKIMTKFGYDVAILGSAYYRHSILGVNLPGTGDYIKFRGKKYYVWETTNTGWKRGIIPRGCSTLSYWNVNLANQMN